MGKEAGSLRVGNIYKVAGEKNREETVEILRSQDKPCAGEEDGRVFATFDGHRCKIQTRR